MWSRSHHTNPIAAEVELDVGGSGYASSSSLTVGSSAPSLPSAVDRGGPTLELASTARRADVDDVVGALAGVEVHLSRVPVLRRLDRVALSELAAQACLRWHGHGEFLLHETSGDGDGDTDPGSVLALVVGWGTAVRSLPDGSRAVVAVCREGELAGIERLLPAPSSGRVPWRPAWVASGDGAAIRLPVAAVRQAIGASVRARDELDRLLAARIGEAEQLLADRFLPPSDRLIRALVRLVGRPAPRRPHAIPLTQGELAALVGTTRETVNRSLRRLASTGNVRLREGRVVPIRRSGSLDPTLGGDAESRAVGRPADLSESVRGRRSRRW